MNASKPRHPIADQFSGQEMETIRRYGQALGGKPTPFSEEVERYLAGYEARYTKRRRRQNT